MFFSSLQIYRFGIKTGRYIFHLSRNVCTTNRLFSLCWSKCLCLRYEYCQWLKCYNKSCVCAYVYHVFEDETKNKFIRQFEEEKNGIDGHLEQKYIHSQLLVVRSRIKYYLFVVVAAFSFTEKAFRFGVWYQ